MGNIFPAPIVTAQVTLLRAQAVTGSAIGAVTCSGGASILLQVSGTFTGATVQFFGTVDGTNFFALPCVNLSSGTVQTSTTSTGQWLISYAGVLAQIKCNVSAISTGSVNALAFVSSATSISPWG